MIQRLAYNAGGEYKENVYLSRKGQPESQYLQYDIHYLHYINIFNVFNI